MTIIRLFAIALASVVVFAGGQARATNYSWTQAAGGNWNVAGNWTPAAIPGSSDSATLGLQTGGAAYAVSLTDTRLITNVTIGDATATLNQSGALTVSGVLAVNAGAYNLTAGTLTLNGSMTTAAGASASWTGGTITGTGVLNGTLVSTGSSNLITGTALQNSGTLIYNGGTISSPNNAVAATFTNQAAGLINFQADGTALTTGVNTPSTLINQGTLRKSAGSSTNGTAINWAVDFQANSTIDVESGTLNFAGGGTFHNGTITLTGNGFAALSAGAFSIPNGATFTAPSNGGNPFALTGGTLTLTGTGSLAGTLAWTGGTITSTGTGTLSGVVTASGSSNLITGTALQNSGTLIYNGGTISSPNNATSATLTNQATGLINFQADGTAFTVGINTPSTLINQGTLRKSAGSSATGTTINWAVDFQANSTIDVESGALNFAGGGTFHNGTITLTGNGLAALSAGAFGIPNGAAFTAPSNGGNPFALTGGTLTVTGTGSLAGTLAWTGGTITGTGTLSGVVTASGSSNLITGTALQNSGTLVYSGGTISSPNNATSTTLTNQATGLINFQADGTAFTVGFNTPSTLINQGTLRKSAGSSATGTTINWAVDFQANSTIDVESGTLSFAGGGTFHNGTMTLTGNGLAALSAGAFSIPNGAAFTAPSNGNNPLALSGGTLAVTGTMAGALAWTGGTIAGAGTGTLSGVITATGTSNLITGTALQNSGTLIYNGGTISSQNNATAATLTNLAMGLINFQSDGTAFTPGFNTTSSLINQGTVRKSGGTSGVGTTVGWTISNTGTIQTTVAGTLILSGGLTNANPGVLEVDSGTLQVAGSVASFTNYTSSTSTLDGGTYKVMANSTLDFTSSRPVTVLGPNATVNLIGVNSTFAAISALATNNGTFSLQSARSFTTAGALSNTGTLDIESGSTLTVTGNFANSGTIMGAGTLAVANATFTGGVYNGTVTFTVSNTLTIAGATTIASGVVNVNGNTQVNSPLTIPTGITLGGAGTVTVPSGSMLTVNGAIGASKPVSVAGTLQGSGTAGAVTLNAGTAAGSGGTLALTSLTAASGASTIQSTVTVSSASSVTGGTLTVAAGANLGGTGSLTVNSGATLAVQGTVGLPTTVAGVLMGNANMTNTVLVQPGGHMAPGNSPGTITISGGLTLNGDYDWDLNGNDNTMAGGTFDKVNGNGPVTLSSAGHVNIVIGSGVDFTNAFWGQPEQWNILAASSGFANNALPLVTVSTNSYQTRYPQAAFTVSETSTALNVVWNPGLQTWVWTGSSGSWNSPANWSPASAPSSTVNTQLSFGASSTPSMTNDIPGTLMLNSLTFNSGSPAYNLSGNGLNFVTNASGGLPQIVSNSANSVTLGLAMTLTNNLTVNGTGAIALNGAISGPGSLTMTGAGTLILVNSANNYSGGTNIFSGTVQVVADSALGTGVVAFNGNGILNYAATTSTARSFNLAGGTLAVSAGATLTFNGGSLFNGFLNGPGTVALTGGTILTSMTTQPNAVINQIGAASFVNFSNGGALNLAANLAAPAVFTGFTNQGSGSITIGANSQLNANNFQTYGLLTINVGIAPAATTLVNTGTSPLFFNGGSRTFIGTPATAGTFTAGVDLHGQSALVAGGLFVNNGYVIDSTGGGAVVIADFGALVKGAGFYENSPQTQNGGRVQAGNSPGSASFGQLTFGPGGVSSYVFAIDDATGTAGPSPNAAGQVSGWGLMKAVKRNLPPVNDGELNSTSGNFTWTADANNKLTFAIETLVNPTTVGTDVSGLMADFDPSRSYSWPAVQWSGSYSGPTDVATLDASTIFDTTGFENPIAGTFGWSFDAAGNSLSLTYTPSAVPEPGTLALLIVAVFPSVFCRRLFGWQRFYAFFS